MILWIKLDHLDCFAERRHLWLELCGAFSLMILLGLPWVFTAFGAIDANNVASELANVEAAFHASPRSMVIVSFVLLFALQRLLQTRQNKDMITTSLSAVGFILTGFSFSSDSLHVKGISFVTLLIMYAVSHTTP